MGIKSKVNGLVISATPSTTEVTKLGRGKYADYEQNVKSVNSPKKTTAKTEKKAPAKTEKQEQQVEKL